MEIIQEVKYDETMKTTVEPYLKQRCISGYTDSYDAVGKLHVLRYKADMPKGVIVICHGLRNPIRNMMNWSITFYRPVIMCGCRNIADMDGVIV